MVDNEVTELNLLGENKPVELLKFIIASGGVNISCDSIISSLWPDADGDHAKNSLDTTIHKLRGILKNKSALTLTNGIVSINKALCNLDSCAFKELISELNSLNDKNISFDEAMRFKSRLLNIYKGPAFLMSKEAPWIYGYQIKTKSAFLRAVMTLGARFEAMKELGRAANIYAAALEHHPISEEICTKLIKLRISQGLNCEAMSTFEEYRVSLKNFMGTKPSHALQNMINELNR